MVPFIHFHCDTGFCPIFFFTDEVLPYFLNAFIIVKTVVVKAVKITNASAKRAHMICPFWKSDKSPISLNACN